MHRVAARATPHARTRRRAPRWFAALAVVAMLSALPAFAARANRPPARPAPAPKTMDARDIKPGMKGYGLTVMRGTKVERFEVEFIGVLHNKLPQQDMIMIRCSGLNLEHSGIIAGMSGSPIYVHDPVKGDALVGALSYGYGFNKDPVAGVTPIADMLPELDRKLRPLPPTQRVSPPARRAVQVDLPGYGPTQMRPVAIPLSMAGFHPDVVADARKRFAGEGLHVVAGSGGGSTEAPSPAFEPGSAISLVLARGDMTMAGVGTVTWVRGDQFIAFGHPFRGVGQLHLPVGGAHVVWVLNSQSLSFKMGYPLAASGVLDQDRQPAIAGRQGPVAEMIPVDITVKTKHSGTERKWHVEVTDQPFFFPMALGSVMGNAVRVSEPMLENAALKATLTVELEDGRAPLVLQDQYLALGGTAQMGEVQSLASNVAKALVFNGFKRIRVKRVRAEFEATEDRPLAFVESVRAEAYEVTVGQKLTVNVDLILPNKGPRTVKLELPAIPKDLAGEKVKVWIGAENQQKMERPPPKDLEDILDAIRDYVPNNRLVAVLQLPDASWMVRGTRLTDLPIGVLDELGGHNRETKTGKETLRARLDIPWNINGHGELTLQVKPQF